MAFSNPSSSNTPLLSRLLSDLPVNTDNLLFGLNFKYTRVDKKGFTSRLKRKKESLDIDLSCILFDKELAVVNTVWFKQLRDTSGAIRHHGDSLNGRDRGGLAEIDRNFDVETIELRLSKLPQSIAHVALLMSSFKGHPLEKVERGDLYISDDEANDIYSADLTLLKTQKAAICVAMLSRELNEWRFTIHDQPLDNHNMEDMTKQIKAELSRFYHI